MMGYMSVYKATLLNILSRLPAGLLRWVLPHRFVLYGHLISDRDDCMASSRYRYPTFAAFELFYNLAERIGYHFVTLEEYFAGKWPRMILLTFDDGFAEVREFHLRTNLPFALFIVTDALKIPEFGLGVFDPQAEAFLSRTDIIKLKQAGVHIGFHTRSHKRIETLSDLAGESMPPDQYMDLISSPKCFAYPFSGPVDYAPVSDALFAAGYAYVFDTKSRAGADGRHVFRISMDRELTDRSENQIFINVIEATLSRYKKLFRRNK